MEETAEPIAAANLTSLGTVALSDHPVATGAIPNLNLVDRPEHENAAYLPAVM
jgi:hypothetical protein